MSELKAFESELIYWAVEQVERVAGDIDSLHLDDNLFYIKSEADEVIAHNKFKRCIDNASLCESEEKRLEAIAPIFDTDKECWEYGSDYWKKWHRRWLELADKFKEAK